MALSYIETTIRSKNKTSVEEQHLNWLQGKKNPKKSDVSRK